MTQLCSLQYILDYEEDGVFQKDIEAFLRIRRSSVSSLLNKMERGGLLFRTPVLEDARLKQLHLTEKGRTLAAEIEGFHAHMEQYVKSILTEEEVVALNAILQKITDSMDGLMEAMQNLPPK